MINENWMRFSLMMQFGTFISFLINNDIDAMFIYSEILCFLST